MEERGRRKGRRKGRGREEKRVGQRKRKERTPWERKGTGGRLSGGKENMGERE